MSIYLLHSIVVMYDLGVARKTDSSSANASG